MPKWQSGSSSSQFDGHMQTVLTITRGNTPTNNRAEFISFGILFQNAT